MEEKLTTDILDSLDDLNYTDHKFADIETFLKCIDDGLKSSAFTNLIAWFSAELRHIYGLEEQVHPIENQDDTSSFLLELSSFLKEIECPYKTLTEGPASQRLASRKQRLELVDFLCSELQAARILAVKQPKGDISGDCSAIKNMKIQESEIAGTLKAMLVALGFSKPPESITSSQLFSKVIERVKEQIKKMPNGYTGKPLFTGILSSNQWETLNKLDQEMRAEYRTRSDLLLKRLDVTIQSFTWSDRVKKMEDDMVKVYRPYRQQLRPESTVGIPDLLAARHDLTLIEKTSGSKVRKNTQSKINKLLMKGRMPDRGGRPTEIEPPPPEMPPWQKERAQQQPRGGYRGGRPQDQRQGGRGRVQGGWSGGGGGGGARQGASGYGGGGDQWSGGGGYGGQHGTAGFQPQYQPQQQIVAGYGGGGNYYQQGGGGAYYQHQQSGGYAQGSSINYMTVSVMSGELHYQQPPYGSGGGYQQQQQNYYQQSQNYGGGSSYGGGGYGGQRGRGRGGSGRRY